jgi:hypothetical protein
MDLKDPWTVGSDRWVSTKGKGSIVMPDGTFRGTQPLHDTKKVTVDMQLLFENFRATTSHGMNYEEVYVAPQDIDIVETPDNIEMTVKGLIYGDIEPITAFTTGDES